MASTPAATYPAVMQALLAQQSNGVTYQVVNKGVSGDNLAGMQARLSTDVLDLHPQLAIVQAGTNDASQGQTDADLKAYTDRLRSVVSQLQPAIQVVLMNGQPYPTQPSNYAQYQSAMETVSAEKNVPIFDRYALMKSWVDSGKYKFSDILASDNFHPNDFTYKCMGEVMAELAASRTNP